MVALATARESLSRDHQGCPMFLHVIEATHLIGHRVFVQFNNGTTGEADLIESQTGSCFEPLRDIEYFRRFSINGHILTLAERGQFLPEFLHALVTSQAVGTGRQTTIRRDSARRRIESPWCSPKRSECV